MTTIDPGIAVPQRPPGRFWILKRIAPYLRATILGLLPYPDLIIRYRTRRTAYRLADLPAWPGREATSEQAAQLAMLRLLWLQRQTRRAVRGRHREASAMLARASVETLFLGLYCLRVPGAIDRLQADNLKALIDGLAYMEGTGIVPVQVIQECVVKLGKPSGDYLSVWKMVTAIDDVNEDEGKTARSLYRGLYVPLSNFTVHAKGVTLLRHVRPNGALRRRPSRAWARRSPARVADAATGLLAADLARAAGKPHEELLTYVNRHMKRALMPMAVIALTGVNVGSIRPHQIRETLKTLKEVYVYLWTGPAAADSVETRFAYVRERFASLVDVQDPDIPEGSFGPFIDYIAGELARAVPLIKP